MKRKIFRGPSIPRAILGRILKERAASEGSFHVEELILTGALIWFHAWTDFPGDQKEREERRMGILDAWSQIGSFFCSSEIRDRISIFFSCWMWCVVALNNTRKRTRYTHSHMVMARFACSGLKISLFLFLFLGDIDTHTNRKQGPHDRIKKSVEKKKKPKFG